MAEPLAAWDIHEAAFPAGGPLADQLAFCLRYAILAPSGHNAQPWLFRIVEDGVELFADRRRALPVVDPEDRELVISCGAALLFLRLALARFGLAAGVELIPEGVGSDLLARLRVTGRQRPAAEEERLLQAVVQRHTDRSPFAPDALPDGLLARLQEAAQEEEAWLIAATGLPAKEAIAALIAAGDRIQGADPRFRRELAAWVHPNRSTSGDGMPGYAFGVGDLASRLGPLVIRTFDIGKGAAARDRELAAGSPALLVLGTLRDNPRAWMQAGQALGRVLLRATAEGLSASFLNQPIEVLALRPRLSEVIGFQGVPQILLRLGRGGGARPTPRRPLEDVLLVPGPEPAR